jgi:hypothetical protein
MRKMPQDGKAHAAHGHFGVEPGIHLLQYDALDAVAVPPGHDGCGQQQQGHGQHGVEEEAQRFSSHGGKSISVSGCFKTNRLAGPAGRNAGPVYKSNVLILNDRPPP